MGKIVFYITQYRNFIFFLFLETICIGLFVSYNKTPQGIVLNKVRFVANRVDLFYSNLSYFFNLKKTNAELLNETAALHNQLVVANSLAKQRWNAPSDSMLASAMSDGYKYRFIPTRVLNNYYTKQNNFLTLHAGTDKGVKPNMAVVSANGIVATIVSVTEHFSMALSVLNRTSKVSAMLLKNKNIGTLEWDGKTINTLLLRHVSKQSHAAIGDTVVASYYSISYPPNTPIGRVQHIEPDGGTSFFLIQVKPFVDFSNIEYAYIVANKDREEQIRAEQQVANKE